MNIKWLEIIVVTSQEAKEAVADMLYCRGATGVIVEDSELPLGALDNEDYAERPEPNIPLEEVRVTAYLPIGKNAPGLVEGLQSSLAALVECGLDPGRAEVVLSEVQEEDWATAWKAYFKPLRIGERLVVKPTWEDVELAPHEVVVEIDPGMAFGTGTHPTTVMCLMLLEKQGLATSLPPVQPSRLRCLGSGFPRHAVRLPSAHCPPPRRQQALGSPALRLSPL